MERRADRRFSAQMGRYRRDQSVTPSLTLGRWLGGTGRGLAWKPSEISLEATKTFGARARWNGARIVVARLRWVDIDETDW